MYRENPIKLPSDFFSRNITIQDRVKGSIKNIEKEEPPAAKDNISRSYPLDMKK